MLSVLLTDPNTAYKLCLWLGDESLFRVFF